MSYELTYVKQYSLNGRLITGRELAANAINTNWIYSSHWKEETWIKDAKNDCISRIMDIEKELIKLKNILRILTEHSS